MTQFCRNDQLSEVTNLASDFDLSWQPNAKATKGEHRKRNVASLPSGGSAFINCGSRASGALATHDFGLHVFSNGIRADVVAPLLEAGNEAVHCWYFDCVLTLLMNGKRYTNVAVVVSSSQ